MENGNAELENLMFGIVFFVSSPQPSPKERERRMDTVCLILFKVNGIHYYLPVECN
jgi:hypothetical protein